MTAVTDPARKLIDLLDRSDQAAPTRSCFLLRVRPDRLTEYVEAHQHVWPEMRAALSAAGWRNYSLFLDAATGTVVGYFEAEDAEQARRAIAATETNARWQAAMRDYFVPPDGGSDHILPQYFYLP
ncbi:MAG: L-rhamnose mutarotase [Pseudoclavibacter sp.]